MPVTTPRVLAGNTVLKIRSQIPFELLTAYSHLGATCAPRRTGHSERGLIHGRGKSITVSGERVFLVI
jgi:hypothetical protein